MNFIKDKNVLSGTAYALTCVVLMIIGFGIFWFSAAYVFKNGKSLLISSIATGTSLIFMIHGFATQFPRAKQDWAAIFIFTIGLYAIILSQIVLQKILEFVL